MATTRYWLVSLPVRNSASSLWSRLQQSISKRSFDTPLYKFKIQNLRVGTLDSLLSLSDDLFHACVSEYNNVRSEFNAINKKQSGRDYWKSEDEGGMGQFKSEVDAYPCVSFTINLI